MKTLFFYLLLFSVSTGFSQSTSIDISMALGMESEVISTLPASHMSPEIEAYGFSPKLNVCAIQQIQEYVAVDMEYPELMITNGIEGVAVIKVILFGNGSIRDFEVVKSPHASFNKEIEKAMTDMTNIDLNGKTYSGVHKIHVPIKFTIGN